MKKKSLLVSRKKVKKVFLARRECLFLMSTNICLIVSSPLSVLPTGFYSLIEEFKDVFQKEMPHRFRLLKGLTHKATLHNRAVYRTNLKEAKEIQHQVVKHLIPRLDDLLDELHDSNVFFIDFKTKFGLYELFVTPFDLTNAPSTFIRLMNHVLRILLAIKVDKDKEKVRSFYGLESFYRRFVKDFSTLTTPLNEIIKKIKQSQGRAFKDLKDKLTHASHLSVPKLC
ncbi:hypothetical protein CR513_55981, partial [Mucuna pruriens]